MKRAPKKTMPALGLRRVSSANWVAERFELSIPPYTHAGGFPCASFTSRFPMQPNLAFSSITEATKHSPSRGMSEPHLAYCSTGNFRVGGWAEWAGA